MPLRALPPGHRAVAEAPLVVFVLVPGGTVGCMLVEGWSFFDLLYMCVITLTTVGYHEVHTLSREGREFTMGLLLTGVFSLFYASTATIRAIVGGELTGQSTRNRMEEKLESRHDQIIDTLRRAGIDRARTLITLAARRGRLTRVRTQILPVVRPASHILRAAGRGLAG